MSTLIRSFILGLIAFGGIGIVTARAADNRSPVDAVPDAVELAVLRSMYENMGGSGWTKKVAWPLAGAWPASATSAQFGGWQGIKVENGDIVEIDLRNNKLTGPLPAVIGNLQKLRLLIIYNNTAMGGAIPTSLTTIQTLQDLNLANCGLTGSIPSALFDLPSLKTLDLQANALTGGIPTNVGNATSLTILSLTANRTLGGPIPVSICSLVNLKTLSLEICALTGAIPNNIGNLINLEILELYSNPLSGGIPVSIGKLKKLTLLHLSENGLTGPIPAGLSALTNLEILQLNSNQLSGHIPEGIGNLTKLVELRLNNNSLTGSIPVSVVKLVKLKVLGLYSNRLTGSLPADMGNMVSLLSVNLSINELTGNIPSSLGALTFATFLNLGKNRLTGGIPPELGGMSALSELYLHENKLTGSIPGFLGNLSKLRTLFLHTNQLSGVVLPELSSLSRMEDFYIYGNRLEGTLPPTLFNTWANLTLVDVSGNQFTGAFPSVFNKTKLVRIVADRNAFGDLPADILTLPVLVSLSIKNNDLATIPLFGSHVNKGNLTLWLENNRLDYSSLQTLKGVGLKAVTFAPQQPIRDITSLTATVGSPLVITARPTGPDTTTVTWEKRGANGTWQSVNALDQDMNLQTFTRSAYVSSDEGVYRWRMQNTVLKETALESEPITVKTAARFVLDDFSFQYKYDNRRRMTHKKVPGSDWEYMVYDDRDRLVMTQDGEQRKLNGWSFTKYDALNRAVMTGIYHHPAALDQAGMSALISSTNLPAGQAGFSETYTGAVTHHGYTNTVFAPATFPADSFDIYSVTYYDKYDFKAGWGTAFDYDSARVQPQIQAGYTYRQPRTAFDRVIGQVTGKKVKTTGSDPYWLYAVNYYDDKNHLVQQVSENYKEGIDRTTTLYDFVGKVLASTTEHTVNTLSWQNLVGARVGVDNLARIAINNNWGNSGASSAQIIPANTDGWRQPPPAPPPSAW